MCDTLLHPIYFRTHLLTYLREVKRRAGRRRQGERQQRCAGECAAHGAHCEGCERRQCDALEEQGGSDHADGEVEGAREGKEAGRQVELAGEDEGAVPVRVRVGVRVKVRARVKVRVRREKTKAPYVSSGVGASWKMKTT